MTFESEGLLIVAIYIWLPPGSYVVFLTTLHGYALTICSNSTSCMNRFSILLIPNKYFSSFINVLLVRVMEIIEITPNVTEVVLLLFIWTRFT